MNHHSLHFLCFTFPLERSLGTKFPFGLRKSFSINRFIFQTKAPKQHVLPRAEVSGLFSKNMKTLKEETILSDRNLSFKDVDACSSDSELGDLLIPEGSDSE